jgi:hypothetical protein
MFASQMVNFAYGDKYAAFLYDAVLLYAIALNETMNKGLDSRSGIVLAKQMRKKLFKGSNYFSFTFNIKFAFFYFRKFSKE